VHKLLTGKGIYIGVLYGIIGLVVTETAYAQAAIRHVQPGFIERDKETVLIFEAPEVSDTEVLEALFFYRTNRSGSFNQIEADFRNGVAEVPFMATSPSIYSVEYYFMIRTVTGRQYTYPDVVADEPPLTVEVISPRVEQFPETDRIDLAILTPGVGEVISSENFLLTAALFYDEEDAGIAENLRVLLNGEDVTDQAEISQFMIRLRQDQISPGEKQVQILANIEGEPHLVSGWQFRVVRTAAAGRDFIADGRRRAFGGDLELGAASQYIAGSPTDYLTGRLNLRGREGDFHYSARGYMTSQESTRIQPQNRFHLEAGYRQNIILRFGDSNPSFSDYTIRGRRVRGLYGGLAFFNERLELELLHGSLQRSIENLFDTIQIEEREGSSGIEELYFLNLDQDGRGAYQRNLTGGRLSIGNEERFRFSLNALRARDDTLSVNRVRNYHDLIGFDSEVATGLNEEQQQYLEQNPDQLQVTSALPKPKENLVVGTEIGFMADRQRIRFQTEFAASLYNDDISEGVLDRQRAEDLGFDLDSGLENFLTSISWLIIVNEQMSTLPFKYRDREDGTTDAELFFPTSILASETALHLNYGSHRIRVDYRWVGPDYQSLANSTIRRDVAGFSISDRFRTAGNRLIFNLGAENLRDNVNGHRSSTINTRSGRFSVGWYPYRTDLPRINAGIRYRERGNDIERFNPYVDPELENAAVQNFEISNGDTLTVSTPRMDQLFSVNTSINQKFNLFDAVHDAGFSYSRSDTRSEVNRYGDFNNQTFSLSLLSRFEALPFRTRLAWNSTKSTALSGLNEALIRSVDLGVDWALLENSLILNGTVSYAMSEFENIPLTITEQPGVARGSYYSPSEADREFRSANSYMIRIRAEYALFQNGSVQALANYSTINHREAGFGGIPNDRIIQLRYIHRF
jgi:hypothetical protein